MTSDPKPVCYRWFSRNGPQFVEYLGPGRWEMMSVEDYKSFGYAFHRVEALYNTPPRSKR